MRWRLRASEGVSSRRRRFRRRRHAVHECGAGRRASVASPTYHRRVEWGDTNEVGRRLPSRLSPSTIALYEECPRRFQYAKVDRLPDPSGMPAVRGTFVHLILEHLFHLPPGERTLEAARAIANRHWRPFTLEDDFAALALTGEQRQEFVSSSWRIIEGYFDLEKPERVEVVSTEERVTGEIAGIPVTGIIDRVERCDEGEVVTDYKSGRVFHPRDREHKLYQGLIYAELRRQCGPVPVAVRFLFPAHNEQLRVKVTEERLTEIREHVDRVATSALRDLEQNWWEPKPGPLCGWCAFQRTCPAYWGMDRRSA